MKFFKQFFHFSPIRMASRQLGTHLKLKISNFRIGSTYRQLCTTESDPLYVGSKFQISYHFFQFLFFFNFSCFFHKPLSPTSFALLDTTTGQMGNAIYLFFLHKIKLIPSLPPISHLSGGTFPINSLGTRTKGRPPCVKSWEVLSSKSCCFL